MKTVELSDPAASERAISEGRLSPLSSLQSSFTSGLCGLGTSAVARRGRRRGAGSAAGLG